ncbi:MAG: DUF1653 domain-containing protein [Cytophagales bacterium]|nr:MAG: DUF1653 domain-containing protein [Cytophagales bacterium]TAF62332.1 MAG: DUF1653 domain-containing protein [Cytophagales bacterium]
MSQAIKKGRYQHFKGQLYEVLDTAKHSETLELMVIYRPLYQTTDLPCETLWVRPLAMFCEMIDHNGQKLQRFTHLED